MSAILDSTKTLFVLIDVQERLIKAMSDSQRVINNSNILIKAANLLGVSVMISEQYTKGLGLTDSRIAFKEVSSLMETKLDSKNLESIKNDLLEKGDFTPLATKLEKLSFSIFNDKAMSETINKSGAKNIVLFGIESHVCVLQSALQGLDSGFNMFVCSDAMSSRSIFNHDNAIALMLQKGINVTNTESVIFSLMEDCKNDSFKAISKLIK